MATPYNPNTGRRVAWEEQQKAKTARDPRKIEQEIALLERQAMALKARDDLLTFTKFTMPDPEDPNDIHRSRYKAARHHIGIANAIQQVEKGDIRFLILVCPPRHGKSELVSRRLPAWFAGRHPEQNVVVATYNDDFAADFGSDVRNIMATPQYKQIFPDVKLQRGGAAKDRLQTTKGGQLTFVGRRGSLTGRGAHCFPAGTLVSTPNGDVPIEILEHNSEVYCYDTVTRTLETRRVEAVAHRPATRLLRVTTAAGRVVEATPDHPFHTARGYVKADELTAGDRLLQLVRRDADADRVRCDEAREAWPHGVLLLRAVLGGVRERQPVRAAKVRRMRGGNSTEQGTARIDREHVLLRSVHGGVSSPKEGRAVGCAALGRLSGVRETVPVRPGLRSAPREERSVGSSFLQHGLQEQIALAPDARGEQSGLSARSVTVAKGRTQRASISRHEADGQGARRSLLRALRKWWAAARPSHRARPERQSLAESNIALSELSLRTARTREVDQSVEADEVLRVDEVLVGPSGVEVFDIQVGEHHNFFADGVLVHNCMIMDDLIKDDNEARSQAIRDEAWNFVVKVAMTRRMGKKLVIMTFTRWNSDDPIGRLTDPENPHYKVGLAKRIKIIHLPAIAQDDDPLGRKPGEPLWPDGPDQFDLDFLEEQQMLDPLGFEALYQGNPSLLDGDIFKRENIRYYKQSDLPDDLRFYCASDHAVSTKQRNDPTVLLKVGIDRYSNIYLVDCFWQRVKSDAAVEAMLTMASGNMAPLIWWAESGHISKSIGPFLYKRMTETETFINIREVTPASDKAQRAQSIAARVGMGKVLFPSDASWTEKAINEMMAFKGDGSGHDDFVDALAYIGLGLQSQFGISAPASKKAEPKVGSAAWLTRQDKWKKERDAAQSHGGF